MKKAHLEHVLRAAKEICEDDEFFVIGSQSLHGKYPDLPDEILVSMEVDLIAKNHPRNTERLNNIGMGSPFHESFGYFADPVDFATAVLPRDWKNRLVHLKTTSAANGAKAYCLEPHDLAVAKIVAWREKDRIVLRELLARKLIDPDRILALVEKVPAPRNERTAWIERFETLVGTQRNARPKPG